MTTGETYNEKELLQQLAGGSEAAFHQLFETYRDKLFTYVFKLSGSRETAEDAVHDVFLKLWTMRVDVMGIENLNAYLYRMVHNTAFNGLRRMARETLVLAEIRERQEGYLAPEGEDRLSHQEVRQLISDLVDRLTPQQRTVFLLSRQEGLKHEEIAQQLDISVNTVKTHIAAALRYLREEIGRQYGADAVIIYVLLHLGHS